MWAWLWRWGWGGGGDSGECGYECWCGGRVGARGWFGCGGVGLGMGVGVGVWIWIWRPILRLTVRWGGSTMVFLTTLHIGRPCHVRCTPWALDRPFPVPCSALAMLCSARGVLPAPPRGPTPAPTLVAPGHLDPGPTPAAMWLWGWFVMGVGGGVGVSVSLGMGVGCWWGWTRGWGWAGAGGTAAKKCGPRLNHGHHCPILRFSMTQNRQFSPHLCVCQLSMITFSPLCLQCPLPQKNQG